MEVIVSDFDHTLFKRNFGLIRENVEYLEKRGLPVYIVTYRAADQEYFLRQTLNETTIDIIGIAFGESRKQDPNVKVVLTNYISAKYDVVEVLDDDQEVVVRLKRLGYNAHTGVAQ